MGVGGGGLVPLFWGLGTVPLPHVCVVGASAVSPAQWLGQPRFGPNSAPTWPLLSGRPRPPSLSSPLYLAVYPVYIHQHRDARRCSQAVCLCSW